MSNEVANDVRYSLPTGWQHVKLEEIVDILDSQRVPVNSKEREGRQGNVPYYGATGQVGWIDDFLFDEELVLLGEDGAPFFDVSKQKAYIIRGKSWVNNHAHVLCAKAGMPSAYLKYFLDVVDYHGFVSGTTRAKLNQSEMRRIPVPLAPLNEQTRIVAEIEKQLSRLEEAVANLKRVKANLKRYKAAVLKAAVEGKLTEEWRRQHPGVEPADKLLERILAERRKAAGKGKYKEPVAPDTNGLPELPAGWVWSSLDQIVECLDSKRVPVNKKERASRQGQIPYYGANGQVGWIDDYLFDEPLVLVVEDETFTGRELPFSYKVSGKVWVNNHAHVLRCTNAVNTDYLNHALSYYPFIPLTTGTTGRKKLTQAALMGAVFSLPPITEQHQIVAEVERRLSIVAGAAVEVDNNLRRADRLRQSILKQAFSGQLVPQNPNDEPASVLLERIRSEVGVTRRRAVQDRTIKGGRGTASPLRKPEPAPASTNDFASLDAVLTAILGRMQPGCEYSRADLADLLGLSTGRWNAAIQELKRRGQVRQVGEKRGARYVLRNSIQ